MNKIVLMFLLLICESAKSETLFEFSSGVYGGYSLAKISNSLSNLNNEKAEGYVVGAEFESIYKSEYLAGLKYQYTSSNYIESSEVFVNLGALFSIIDNRLLSFYFDFLLGVNFYRWKSIEFTVNKENSTYSSNSFSYGGDLGLRSLLMDFLELKLSYQNTALARAATYVDLQPNNTDSSGSVVVNNKSSFLFTISYKFN